MFRVYAAIAGTRVRPWATAGLIVTVGGAGLLLPGAGYAAPFMPAAGALISRGYAQDMLRLFDQVLREPGWIPVFAGGLLYNLGHQPNPPHESATGAHARLAGRDAGDQRRERLHPGAWLSLFEERDGWRTRSSRVKPNTSGVNSWIVRERE
jgi:hypothetical protein